MITAAPSLCAAQNFMRDVAPILKEYCITCHGGDEPHGSVAFDVIRTSQQIEDSFETWESVVKHLQNRTMPPKDERQPSDKKRQQIIDWYIDFIRNVQEQPAVFRPRRLSVTEYRNTLRTVMGFDLQNAVAAAEQTRTEPSMVIKLLPTDPPGTSGFTNDTYENPLTTVVWDQYGYLTRLAIDRLFSMEHRHTLEAVTGPLIDNQLSAQQTLLLLEHFGRLTHRRPLSIVDKQKIASRIHGQSNEELTSIARFELQTMLMSPQFIYRGLLMHSVATERQPVDDFELAERLSYFLWADMPDDVLLSAAAEGHISESDNIQLQIDRMIASPKIRALAEVFATEWLSINEIEHVTDNLPQMLALKSQPIDFMHYLFTNDRPLLELIDSDVTFINPHTKKMYGGDANQMTRYVKRKGIEVEAVPNQKVILTATKERGGVLTMPGILAMNRGPILRGTWILERILGEPLPEPPPDVGVVPPNPKGQHLTFRERFEHHRANATCAICHDKIDPLGFALQNFGDMGQFLANDGSSNIDTTGQLPSGETFADMAELKKILTTSQRDAVLRNIVEKTMSYALCRKLTLYDQPVVHAITVQMTATNGTWRQLFVAIANSVPFRETMISETGEEAP